jgi:hypothetical protein
MKFGNDTVELVNYTPGTNPDPFGHADPVESVSTQRFGRFRPLNLSEVKTLTDENEELWRWTAIPSPELDAATSESHLRYGGMEFEIWGGIARFTDASGRPFKYTIMAKRVQTQIA